MSMDIPPQDPVEDPELPAPVAEEQDDDIVETQVGAGGQKMVPLASLIEARKSGRETKAALATAQQKAAQFDQMAPMLQHAQPFLQHLQSMTPQQQAAAILAAQQGTAPSRVAERQPADDGEATELAEDLGLVDANGGLDISRARRMLDRLDRRADQRAEQRLAPLRQTTAAGQAQVMRQRVSAMTDKNTGAPLASEESLSQVFGMVPAELAADPNVAMVLALAAAGMDRAQGRVAQARQAQPYGEPMFTEAPGGRRAAAGPSQMDREIMKRTGVSDKDYAITQQLAGGRGIALE